MMRDYSYAYEWDQEYCYESINRMFARITTPISEEEQKENIRLFFWKQGKAACMAAGSKPVTCRNLRKIILLFSAFLNHKTARKMCI